MVKATSLCDGILGSDTPLSCNGINLVELNEAAMLINQVIDHKQSQIEGRTVVQYGANERLDELRQVYDRIEDILVRTN